MSKFFINAILFTFLSQAIHATPIQVEKWDVFELSLHGPIAGNPFTDVELSATFIIGDRAYAVDGFYDGDGVYKIRFMPDEEGKWRYITQSNIKMLSRKKGKFICTPPSANNHGPVHVHNTYYLRYADGAPFLQIGTTCYAWTHQGDEMEEQTLATLVNSPFNKVRMCLFPKSYAYNENEPLYYPFAGEPLTNWDFTRFNPAFWRHFEGRVRDLQRLGIEADIILFHPYDRWGFASMDRESDARYLRYVTARLSAFRNVWWSIANEYDLMSKSMADWDRFFSIIVQEDPYNHMRSIHNCRTFYDHSKSWVTHVSAQSSDMAAGVHFREQYKKPVIYDECQYEGNIPQGWGDLSPQEMTARFWLGAMGGCYVGHGETYQDPEDKLWWSKGGVLRGSSPARIAFFRTILTQAPLFEALDPLGNDQGLYVLGKSGEFYMIYFVKPETVSLALAGDRDYRIEMIDPWEMTVSPIGSAAPGAAAIASLFADRVYRLTPYKEHEPRLPSVSAKADVLHGSVPLTVHLTASGTASTYVWRMNGTLSNEANTSFIFTDIGQHVIKLTGTDANGLSAESFLIINALPKAPENFDADINWPGNRDNLIFYWKQGQKVGDLSQINKPAALVLEGRATFASDGALKLTGGNVSSAAVTELLYECRKTHQLGIEAMLRTDNLEQGGPARLITFSSGTNARNFTLGQEKENLIFRLRTPMTGENALDPQVTLCAIEKNARTHIIVSYCDGNLFVYKNGVLQKHIQDIQGDFSPWQGKAQFIIGNELTGDREWHGTLYNVALYSRFITEEEARFKYQIAMNKNDSQLHGRFF
ncbi:DUF5060 domain-containing protein [candidate division KSB1 bacterium]|nr:DUF5060 domain-containing protein [candidate division KSB1 bacterium]RQW11375.1 MAG: DUF5060 domain-containing protein [candidate division KSB1 bacterium]